MIESKHLWMFRLIVWPTIITLCWLTYSKELLSLEYEHQRDRAEYHRRYHNFFEAKSIHLEQKRAEQERVIKELNKLNKDSKSPVRFLFNPSAYYWPVPDQDDYMHGSYEADLAMNSDGNPSLTKSEKTPYIGAIAADGRFAIGTRIWIPQLGIFVVEDRGGAIKGNRIDIWCGKGMEGLERARFFGINRHMAGYVIPDDFVIDPSTPIFDGLISTWEPGYQSRLQSLSSL